MSESRVSVLLTEWVIRFSGIERLTKNHNRRGEYSQLSPKGSNTRKGL